MSDIKFLHDSFDNELVLEDYGLGENPPKVIIVEDDHVFSSLLKKFIFRRFNLEAQVFNTPNSFINYIDSETNIDQQSFCLISDISFDDNGMDGLLLLDILKEKDLKFFAILMTGFASVETAIAATKKGVFHYLTKPFELNSLGDLIQEAYKEKFQVDLSSWLNLNNINKISEKKINVGHKFKIEHPTASDMFCGMIGRSKKMKSVFERINKVSATDSTVLINGPSGTGKELVANAIHLLSLRKNASLVSINCGAIPEDLLESELFGHVKGAFTGAVLDRKGRFELANKGTIFLDEIGDMPLLLQVKLLRVLQSRTIDLVGGTSPKDIDVRIITASHRNLEHMVSEGNFREDLFYRLNVIPVIVPSLTERREDIPLLISYFLSRFISADGRNNVKFDN
ncbi:MAG: sigma-54-dependent Fis family transcriptional regulator, partial [Bdellovibrionales bacterium]|nr:sigma-54-dependent Fis family transcriptional regulator [Bdellovibrionales bacterium]